MKEWVGILDLSGSTKLCLGQGQLFPVLHCQFNQSFAFYGVGCSFEASSVAIWRAWSQLSIASWSWPFPL